jgi:membrane protease YdiL (CAAX protease family)
MIFGFATIWMIKSINYLYVASLIFLLIENNFLYESSDNSNKIINLKGYDIWGLLVIIAGITVLLLFIGFKSSVILIMAIVTFAISVWIIIKYQKLITKSLIIKGLIIGGLCALAQYNFFPSLIAIFITVPFFYISASLLNDKFRFKTIHFNSNSYAKLIKSFVIGCLFALPMALSNLSEVITTNPFKWINQFWKPILAFNFVLLEETWVRLFIVTFIFALVISKTEKKIIPIITAILISSSIFGFTHDPNVTIPNCFNIAILFGLPLGVMLYKRDFETVVGYHFMINFISAVSTYVINH